MKVAVGIVGTGADSQIDTRFGRAARFALYDNSNGTWEMVDNAQNLQAAQGAGIQSAATVVNAGCDTLVCGHCGPKAFGVLSRSGVAVYQAAGATAREAVDALGRGELKRLSGADVEGHW